MHLIIKKKYLVIVGLITVVLMSSCKDDNKGYDEYYNPMGNNPAMIIPWMEKLTKDLRKTHAIMQAYSYNDEIYYTLQIYSRNSGISTSPYTIFEGDEDEKIIYYHTDDVLTVTPANDSLYFDFKDNASFQFMIWRNVPKSDSNIEF